MTSDDSFAALFGAQQAEPHRADVRLGDRVDVVVTKVGKDAIFVALDGKQEGYIERVDLTTKEGKLTVEEGSKIVAKVVERGGKAGAVRLEPLVVRRGGEDATAEAAPTQTGPVLEVGLKVKGAVTRVERYGVFVQITGSQGKRGRGLLPAQESGLPRGADLYKAFPIGAEVECKITKIEEDGKIRLSVTELRRDEERKDFESFKDAGDAPTERKKADERPRAPRSLGTFGDLFAKSGITVAKK